MYVTLTLPRAGCNTGKIAKPFVIPLISYFYEVAINIPSTVLD
jgi:hypothetical protein